jgi:hypothetical protein
MLQFIEDLRLDIQLFWVTAICRWLSSFRCFKLLFCLQLFIKQSALLDCFALKKGADFLRNTGNYFSLTQHIKKDFNQLKVVRAVKIPKFDF